MSLSAIFLYLALIGLGCAALYWLLELVKLPAPLRLILVIVAAVLSLVWLAGRAGVAL